MFNKIPDKQGLYDPRFEHDACGMGFVVNIKGNKSHNIIQQGLEVLVNLAHRGAAGSESNTGDGAGILIQIPHAFFQEEVSKLGFSLPEEGEYGVGMVFLSQSKEIRKKSEKIIEKIVNEEGQILQGWRTVPVNSRGLGKTAQNSMPYIRQFFITKCSGIKDDLSFARKLYVIRKRIEKSVINNKIKEELYIASLSQKTIVYKGMLTSGQLEGFYPDLNNQALKSAIVLIHSRFSTNTFPSWERAHPNRYIIHNGEINTLRGNANWMRARQANMKTDVFASDMGKLFPIIDDKGSDSAMFDNALEFLALSGRSLSHASVMMIPEPWDNQQHMEKNKEAFYRYHSCLMEPWDGPAAVAFSDGICVGAVLDRNGLRPVRYSITEDDLVILSSEVGVLDLPESKILSKQRLEPGKMLLIDTEKGVIKDDRELKEELANEYPYQNWLNKYFVELDDLPEVKAISNKNNSLVNNKISLIQLQQIFAYTYEDLQKVLLPMAKKGVEPLGSMGSDVALAVLSEKPQLLYNYFKQLFAQVTNPPIDSIREEIITSTRTLLGSEGNLLKSSPESCRQISLKDPIISNENLAKLEDIDLMGFQSNRLDITFKSDTGKQGLEKAMDRLFAEADKLVEAGVNILILSDKELSEERAAIPALLAAAGLHHHLIRTGKRISTSIILESAEPREVHHFCLLLGYGVDAINPYLAYRSIKKMVQDGFLTEIKIEKAVKNYHKAVIKGIVKVMAKMGISTIQSYRGAQIFEALGINDSVINKYFTGTPSRIGGIGLEEITRETLIRHEKGFAKLPEKIPASGSNFSWRKNGEEHLYNPRSIYLLQKACREGDYKLFKEYSGLINNKPGKAITLRSQLKLKKTRSSIPLRKVEPVASICRRFKTGAMSFGSLSKEAHETLAIAMNRIGGKSNTGEGGEDPRRFRPYADGDSRCSAIKQVASGRFGVTSNYLVNAQEIQIKMAQGAKPGEGGQLPGKKVYPWIAKVRGTTPGVALISPPPHHDIYSIEDLAELIYDLKNANPEARINVKLVSEMGVGTIAAGVAKAKADVILISGSDGGTGASPRTGIQHAGLPWELGVAEAHQTLVLNNLRDRVKIETDGKLMTGRDLVIASFLGAEEFSFATAPLVALGCVMMRVCNLNTCPVGIATQNPELRKNFRGKPEYVVNFMKFIAQEMREKMAEMGFRTVDEMVGKVDMLERDRSLVNWKNKNIDYENILYKPARDFKIGVPNQIEQNYDFINTGNLQELLAKISAPTAERDKIELKFKISNRDRAAGTLLGSKITKKYGENSLNEDTLKLNFRGTAGQSFGAFIPQGMTLILEGDANDYIGKGLSGGKIIVKTPRKTMFSSEKNISIGNVAFFGATAGEAFIEGAAGERFCVRNSGIHAVVEGIGDHGCEYMTGGCVVILGQTGRNFAAGMTGGAAFVLDIEGDFADKCNKIMVDLSVLKDRKEIRYVKRMVRNHFQYTGSKHAQKILVNWQEYESDFIRVMPRDYNRMISAIRKFEKQGLSGEEVLMEALLVN